ncbi:transglycosylase domain-containing protein [Lentzea chajnantorensis]
MILGPVIAVAVAYPLVNWPRPDEIAADQDKTITLKYSDGSEMGKITSPGQNRTMLTYEEIPDNVKHAVLAAEDANFYENPGFDAKAIVRAVWIQATGGSSGGSGLTQQYIKKATGKEEATLTRKFTELVKAYKMSNESDHNTILTAYLNTVYFGRGANGMKAAAQVYYKKEMKDLTPSEAAYIAGMIQLPSYSEDKDHAQGRWEFVMGQMLQKGWIDQAYYDAQKVPVPLPFEETQPQSLEGPLARVSQQVQNEIDSDMVGLTMERAQKVGVTVHTTVDPKMQNAAVEAVNAVMNGEDPDLRTSLSAIDPTTGAVRAYYPGKDGLKGIDYAKGTIQEAGSSFKPFDLVAALKIGKGIGDTYDGTSPRKIAGVEIRNASSSTCGPQCPIKQAMKESLNTVFYDMVANDTGPKAVADAAHAAGIPETVPYDGKPFQTLVGEGGGPPNTGISIGADNARVRPFDMASAYATFAARGMYRPPFFVTKIEAPNGDLLYQHVDKSTPAFDPVEEKSRDIADNVTETLKEIPTGKIACAASRPCAGKTGTHELPESKDQNSKAWMVGYTPQLSTSVWVGKDKGDQPIRDRSGKPVFGSGLPGLIWKKFMDAALDGYQKESFAKPRPLGNFNPPPPSKAPVSNTAPSTQTNTTTTEPTRTPPTKTTDPDNGNCGILPCPPSGTKPTTTKPGPGNPTGGRDPGDT